jgi:hypothetical protein
MGVEKYFYLVANTAFLQQCLFQYKVLMGLRGLALKQLQHFLGSSD